ncbi:RmlC-like cupin domain-containing protein [Talaromyces proteolyticus]|uniref:RmlC-like cupin domain-containing protein n=1 Tax=Talaromyces proteolyticus TaxID=1131652 RepID=A0AAD4KT08_9EURO|nr:RmlC-like cupin domain-containing protein [Talaromyces proteolyticus]KAH8698657.1 RmlC-like cupin domain-containing protein [Talaromyces proteolyticus]
MKTTSFTQVVASVLLMALATNCQVLHASSCQAEGVTRTVLQQHDIDVPGKDTVQDIVDFGPGTTFPRHTHPGEEVIYILDGLLEYQIDGKPAVTLKAGDVFFVPAGVVHSVRNLGNSSGSELATYILEKGQPPVTCVQ